MRIATVSAVVLSAAITTSGTYAEPIEEDPAAVPGARVRTPPRDRWVSFASWIPTRHGIESIPVGRQAGAFRSLRIDALSGTVHVHSVRVEFSNGRMATFFVSRRLDRRQPQAYIDLIAPRFIDNIVITTARKPAGSYAVYGAQGLATGYDMIARN
jgi:hypothetical protein